MIFPVQKPRTDPERNPIYRFVYDLYFINSITRAPVVPNPATITKISATATYFTVIHLCAANFSIPVDPASQYLFAFTLEDQQYMWTQLPQGYNESPTLFSQISKTELSFLCPKNQPSFNM